MCDENTSALQNMLPGPSHIRLWSERATRETEASISQSSQRRRPETSITYIRETENGPSSLSETSYYDSDESVRSSRSGDDYTDEEDSNQADIQFIKESSEAVRSVKPSRVSITDTNSNNETSYYDSVEGFMSLLSDYECEVEDGNNPADMYDLLEFMGEGCYGKVMKCLNKETGEIVALKAIKMCEYADYFVARELYMMDKISALDPDADHIIRFNKYFKSADGHHCMEFELLDLSVDNLMKRRRDLLISLKGLRSVGVMHTDVKPDNVMCVDQQNKPFRVKLIDFGVATLTERAKPGTWMQPLGFRAPEVTLGLPLTEAVDMWSLGCCLLEWYLSVLPFPVHSPYDHMQMITHFMGVPDGELIKQAMYGNDYFVEEGSEWRLKEVSEYKGNSELDIEDRRVFVDLLQKMFHVDPDKRITPAEALSHPFITMTSRTETSSTTTQGIEETSENANEMSESSTRQPSEISSPEIQ
uniref:Protein kinase domain-containing protein n=1 Tax=Neogobius melanostomus TaxID=47308 RepID=A0A8C6V8C6_9GOBI